MSSLGIKNMSERNDWECHFCGSNRFHCPHSRLSDNPVIFPDSGKMIRCVSDENGEWVPSLDKDGNFEKYTSAFSKTKENNSPFKA